MIYRVYCGADRHDVGPWGVNPDGFIPECGAETDFEVHDFNDLLEEERRCGLCLTTFDPDLDLKHATIVGKDRSE